MGGSSGQKQAVPQQAQNIDYNAVMQSAREQAITTARAQAQAQVELYPQMESLQLGTVGKIRNNLNNDYTRQAKGIIDTTLQQGATQLSATGNRINALGDLQGNVAMQAQRRAMAGPSSIEQSIYDQAASDLSLGRSLNAEEQRNASQSARGAYSARGLGVGSGAAAAEILNRAAYGDARYQQRLGNAQAANQTMEQGMQGRQNAAAGLLGQTANLYGQAGGAFQNAASLGFGGANALVNLDPYQRALGIGVQLGSGIQGNNGQMIGNAFNQAGQMAGNVASFNVNRQDSLYNSAMNNNAAITGSQNAANAAMWGAGIGAVGTLGGAAMLCYVAREVYGVENPAWLEFRNWLLTRGSYRRVTRYAEHGPRIAAYISTRPGWKAKLRKWMDACRAQLTSA
jgi:hypothetical protein